MVLLNILLEYLVEDLKLERVQSLFINKYFYHFLGVVFIVLPL
jgi:hypothetical protein